VRSGPRRRLDLRATVITQKITLPPQASGLTRRRNSSWVAWPDFLFAMSAGFVCRFWHRASFLREHLPGGKSSTVLSVIAVMRETAHKKRSRRSADCGHDLRKESETKHPSSARCHMEHNVPIGTSHAPWMATASLKSIGFEEEYELLRGQNEAKTSE